MSMSTRGMTISCAILNLAARKTPRRRDDVVDLGNRRLLQHRTVGDRRLGAAEPQDRRLEVIEGVAFGDRGGKFGPDAERLHALVDHEELPRLPDAGDDR